MEKPRNIEAWASWFRFKTFGERQLENMLTEASRFVKDVCAGGPRRWLTLAGSSGAGKTYLAKRIYRHVREAVFFKTSATDQEIVYPYDWIYWPEAAKLLQQQVEPEAVYHSPRTSFLVLDELGGIRDSTGYVSNRLAVILGQRENKWTIITSNLTVEQIGQRLDTRIASRLIRGRNVVVEVDATDYALRNV
jgi:DNA replication protein DnaC